MGAALLSQWCGIEREEADGGLGDDYEVAARLGRQVIIARASRPRCCRASGSGPAAFETYPRCFTAFGKSKAENGRGVLGDLNLNRVANGPRHRKRDSDGGMSQEAPKQPEDLGVVVVVRIWRLSVRV